MSPGHDRGRPGQGGPDVEQDDANTVARRRAEALLEGLRRGLVSYRPGCPCGCSTVPGVRDDSRCARHQVRPASRSAIEITADHFAGVGMLPEVREVLAERWRVAW
ncbi:MAG: hypothetical protein U0Q19_17025 [Kineosporiaceae bacterium]